MKVSARIFPVGFIISVDNANFNPHEFYIDGNWERIKGRVIVGVDENQSEFNVTGKIGGSKFMQKHIHTIRAIRDNAGTNSQGNGIKASDSTGNNSGFTPYSDAFIGESGTGNSGNLPPYQTAYIWKLISYSN